MAKPIKAVDPVTPPPVMLERAELDYLNTLIAQRKQIDLTLNSFSGYLSQKYQLREGDSLTPDGTIQRKAPG